MVRSQASLVCMAAFALAIIASATASRELLAVDPVVGAPSAVGALGKAPAPGPAAVMPRANLLFTLTSSSATLTAEKLTLSGVADTATVTSASQLTGVYPVATFINSTAGSQLVSRNGLWLNDPVVLMRANATSALLQLASSVYNATAKTVAFQSRILPPAESWASLPTSGGVTARFVDTVLNGLSAGVLTAPPADELHDVALFFDVSSLSLGAGATTETTIINNCQQDCTFNTGVHNHGGWHDHWDRWHGGHWGWWG